MRFALNLARDEYAIVYTYSQDHSDREDGVNVLYFDVQGRDSDNQVLGLGDDQWIVPQIIWLYDDVYAVQTKWPPKSL